MILRGKHTPPGDEAFRQSHKTKKDGNIDANNILPAVTIRDPLVWLQSMCRHHYTAHSATLASNHCPDFSSMSDPRFLQTWVQYSDFSRRYQSILHLWNDYYQEYLQASFPRLLVRFEDLLFHPKAVTKSLCECAGGSMNAGRFRYIVDSAKKGPTAHGNVRTGYIDALVKYGSANNRYQNFHSQDLEYIKQHVDKELMNVMQYPDISNTQAKQVL